MGNVIDIREARAKRDGIAVVQEPNREFGDRLHRIKSSLEKINKLMAELKKMSKEQDVDHSPQKR